MSEKIDQKTVSRRGVLSRLGLAATWGFFVPTALIATTDADARVGNPASAVSVAGANRRDRRDDRRDARYKKKNKKKKTSE